MNQNLELFRQVEEACLQCDECPLCETRRHVVFGCGNPKAPIMLIGEGPGEQEDLQGEPFVGAAGKLLDDMLTLIGLDRTKLYICNIVKCRPPRNRDPLRTEQEACRHWLDAQIQLIDPDIILCLGRVAANALIKPDFRITREHGQWFLRDHRRIMAIYHPSALLRDEQKRPETFADLREFRRVVRMSFPELYPEEE